VQRVGRDRVGVDPAFAAAAAAASILPGMTHGVDADRVPVKGLAIAAILGLDGAVERLDEHEPVRFQETRGHIGGSV
jgi:hypothetical protein